MERGHHPDDRGPVTRDFLQLGVSNALTRPGGVTMLGSPVDLSAIDRDSYLVAGITDHICPWRSCYRSTGALILCLAFIALGGVPVTDVKILSTGLAVGIIIDATVIRGVLAPALVALFGRANWWLPRPAARLLRVTPLTARKTHASPAPPGDVRYLGRPGR